MLTEVGSNAVTAHGMRCVVLLVQGKIRGKDPGYRKRRSTESITRQVVSPWSKGFPAKKHVVVRRYPIRLRVRF